MEREKKRPIQAKNIKYLRRKMRANLLIWKRTMGERNVGEKMS